MALEYCTDALHRTQSGTFHEGDMSIGRAGLIIGGQRAGTPSKSRFLGASTRLGELHTCHAASHCTGAVVCSRSVAADRWHSWFGLFDCSGLPTIAGSPSQQEEQDAAAQDVVEVSFAELFSNRWHMMITPRRCSRRHLSTCTKQKAARLRGPHAMQRLACSSRGARTNDLQRACRGREA